MSIKQAPVILPANSPILPPNPPQEVAWALKGIAAGEADKGQQGLAIRWIVNILCGTYDLPYRPGSPSDTDVACGKMFVGQQLVRLINMTPEQIKALPKMGARSPEEDDSLPNM